MTSVHESTFLTTGTGIVLLPLRDRHLYKRFSTEMTKTRSSELMWGETRGSSGGRGGHRGPAHRGPAHHRSALTPVHG